jgi:hypothetical protein
MEGWKPCMEGTAMFVGIMSQGAWFRGELAADSAPQNHKAAYGPGPWLSSVGSQLSWLNPKP